MKRLLCICLLLLPFLGGCTQAQLKSADQALEKLENVGRRVNDLATVVGGLSETVATLSKDEDVDDLMDDVGEGSNGVAVGLPIGIALVSVLRSIIKKKMEDEG